MRIPPALKDDCWGARNSCVFRQVGTTIQFRRFVGYTNETNGVLTLGSDGVMRGSMTTKRDNETIQMQIDLKQ